ncbi:MAG: M28 family peptidase [Thermoguttaceae bacterium]
MASRPALLLAAITIGIVAVLWGVLDNLWPGKPAAGSALTLEKIPFDGAQAYEYLKQLCAIGPRPSGSAGMEKQQRLLAEHFQKLGGTVEFQKFRAQDPRDGTWAPMANLIVRWHPQSKERILLCAHYDTLPFPLQDRINPRGTFVGANDNASGVALLMELGRDMPKLSGKYGVDFVFLDAEEYVFARFGRRDPMYLGAEFFAQQYAKEQAGRPQFRYRWGVLLDMVGAENAKFPIEGNSASWRDARPLLNEIWSTATLLGVRDFVSKKGEEIEDDHLVLHNLGGISCIDVIQPLSDYRPWHTQEDTAERCSALTLAKVGWVMREWLRSAK